MQRKVKKRKKKEGEKRRKRRRMSRGIPVQPTNAYYLYAYTRAYVRARAISNNRVSRVSGEIFIIAGGDTKTVEDASLR